MVITKIKATIYQDSRRNTATCYLKFNDIKEEIFLGFDLNQGNELFKNKTAKTKISKTQVIGISAELIHTGTGDFHLQLKLDFDQYFILLESTQGYPVTHQGTWEKQINFNDWLVSNQPKETSLIRKILNENNL